MERQETAAMVARRLYNKRTGKLKNSSSTSSLNSPKFCHQSPLATPKNKVKTPLRSINLDQNVSANANPKFIREINEIKKELYLEKMKIDDLEFSLSKKHKENHVLKNNIENLKKKLQEATGKLNSYVDLELFQELKEKYEKEIKFSKTLTDDLRLSQSRSKDLEAEIELLFLEKSKLNDRLEEMFNDNKSLSNQLIDFKQKQIKLKDDLRDFQKENEKLNLEIDELKQTISRLEEVKKSISPNESFVNNILNTQNQEIKTEPLSLFTEIMLKDQVEANSKLQDDFETLKKHLKVLEGSFEDQQKIIDRLKQEKENLENQLEHNKKMLNESYRDLKIFVNKQMAQKQRSAEKTKLFQNTIARNNMNIESLREESEKWKNEFLNLQEKSKVFEEKIREVEESWKEEKLIKEQFVKQNMILEARIRTLELQKMQTSPKRNQKVPPRGTGSHLFMADEEGQFMDARNLTDLKKKRKVEDQLEDPITRLSILQARNSHFAPHLKSSYPIETQNINIEEKIIKGESRGHSSSNSSTKLENDKEKNGDNKPKSYLTTYIKTKRGRVEK